MGVGIEGEYVLPLPPEACWQALHDPGVLETCIPGCEALKETHPGVFEAVAVVRIGPVKARFKARVAITEAIPPHECRIAGEGQGGVAGFAKGSAHVRLLADNGSTCLSYDVDAQVGGKLADEFFERFSAAVASERA